MRESNYGSKYLETSTRHLLNKTYGTDIFADFTGSSIDHSKMIDTSFLSPNQKIMCRKTIIVKIMNLLIIVFIFIARRSSAKNRPISAKK
jgi:hypothetical protein